MARDGAGSHSIARILNKEGVPVFGRGKPRLDNTQETDPAKRKFWHKSTIEKILKGREVSGEYLPKKKVTHDVGIRILVGESQQATL